MQITTADDIKKLGTILGVWAHPDDETFSMGGIMAAAIKNGQVVAFVTATRGEAGAQDETRWPASGLGDIRTKELEQAMQTLGVTKHEWLNLADGKCAEADEQAAVGQIAEYIKKYGPDSIFTFGPEGLTGHPDHQAVSRWVTLARDSSRSKATIYHATLTPKQYEAAKAANNQFNLFFNINRPPLSEPEGCAVCLKLDDSLCELKLAALKAMPSQYEAMFKDFEPALRQSFSTEAFIKV